MPHPTLEDLFPLAILVHNLEEALWLPAWSQSAGRWHVAVGQAEFSFAVACLTTLAFAVYALARRAGHRGPWRRHMIGYAGAMLLNVLAPHLTVTLASGRVAPGLISALSINAPVMGGLVLKARREGLRWRVIGGYTLGWAMGMLASIPALFALGRAL